MINSQKKETKTENEIKEPKNENIVSNNNTNNANINNSERLSLKPSKRNSKKFEKEGTEINLIPEELYLNQKNNDENKNEKNENASEKKEEQIEIKEETQNQKNSEISDYSNLPKVKNGKVYTKAEMFVIDVREAEDNCNKCPLRCLLFIPIFIGYCFNLFNSSIRLLSFLYNNFHL